MNLSSRSLASTTSYGNHSFQVHIRSEKFVLIVSRRAARSLSFDQRHETDAWVFFIAQHALLPFDALASADAFANVDLLHVSLHLPRSLVVHGLVVNFLVRGAEACLGASALADDGDTSLTIGRVDRNGRVGDGVAPRI